MSIKSIASFNISWISQVTNRPLYSITVVTPANEMSIFSPFLGWTASA
nr:MAG TPA: hypothetical protein [Caudoviricetes sp.]